MIILEHIHVGTQELGDVESIYITSTDCPSKWKESSYSKKMNGVAVVRSLSVLNEEQMCGMIKAY